MTACIADPSGCVGESAVVLVQVGQVWRRWVRGAGAHVGFIIIRLGGCGSFRAASHLFIWRSEGH